jgi:transcriptional regulator with XRE-family HTH domain
MAATRELNPTAGPLFFFGAEVRRWRNAAGLSQEQLGQQIGYSVAVLPDSRRAVRDSEDPDGGALVFGTGDWLAFITKIKGGAADPS